MDTSANPPWRKRRTRLVLAIIVGLCVAIVSYRWRSPTHDRNVSIAEIVRAINAGEIDSLMLRDHDIVAGTRSSQRLIAAREPGGDGINLLINVGADRTRLSAIPDLRYVPDSVWGRTGSRLVNVAAFLLPIFGITAAIGIVAGINKKKKQAPAVVATVVPPAPPAREPAQPPEPVNVPALPAANEEPLPSEPAGDTPNVRWHEIVGLEEAKRALQNCARVLKNPSLLTSLGGIPRRGLLLVGSQETRRSVLAVALAAELDARLFYTVGSAYVGYSEVDGAAIIRELFAKARSVSRAVVLVDDLDMFGKRRSNNRGGPSGAVDQLIAEFDGFDADTNIVVVGTAERRDAIDEALLEECRFDHTIDVGPPTEKDRRDMIAQHASGKLFDASWNDEARQRLAVQAEGMISRNFHTIMKDAAYRAALRGASALSAEDVQKAFSAESYRMPVIPPKETQENEASGSRRFEERFRESTATIVDEESPKVAWAQIAGATEAKKALQEHARYLREPEALTRLGVRPRRGVLLVGPPGTGKTLLARAAATDLGARFFSASGATFVDMFVGVGAARIRHLFAQAKAAPAAVIFVDEIDAVGRRRSNRQFGSVEYDHALNQLLVEIDGFEKNSTTLIIGATNRLDVLDPALLRGGRFERIINVELPNPEERKEIIRLYEKDRSFDATWDDEARDDLVRETSGMSGADIEAVFNEAAYAAASNNSAAITRADVLGATQRVSFTVNAREKAISE